MMFENHAQDARYRKLQTAQSIKANYGEGGNNQPLVLKVRCGCDGGGKGALIQENKSATLGCNNDQSVFVFNTGPEVRIEDEVSPVLRSRDYKDPIAVYSLQGNMIGREDKNGPQGIGIKENTSFTLNATDHHAVTYGIDRNALNQGQNAKITPTILKETQPSMVARGEGAIGNKYMVRRLTPLECCRLQGFPDGWCDNLEIENPTDEDMKFWKSVFDTWTDLNGKKRKTENQIRKWLKEPKTDAAQYKMWGNGIALPCAEFVLDQIEKKGSKSNGENQEHGI